MQSTSGGGGGGVSSPQVQRLQQQQPQPQQQSLFQIQNQNQNYPANVTVVAVGNQSPPPRSPPPGGYLGNSTGGGGGGGNGNQQQLQPPPNSATTFIASPPTTTANSSNNYSNSNYPSNIFIPQANHNNLQTVSPPLSMTIGSSPPMSNSPPFFADGAATPRSARMLRHTDTDSMFGEFDLPSDSIRVSPFIPGGGAAVTAANLAVVNASHATAAAAATAAHRNTTMQYGASSANRQTGCCFGKPIGQAIRECFFGPSSISKTPVATSTTIPNQPTMNLDRNNNNGTTTIAPVMATFDSFPATSNLSQQQQQISPPSPPFIQQQQQPKAIAAAVAAVVTGVNEEQKIRPVPVSEMSPPPFIPPELLIIPQQKEHLSPPLTMSPPSSPPLPPDMSISPPRQSANTGSPTGFVGGNNVNDVANVGTGMEVFDAQQQRRRSGLRPARRQASRGSNGSGMAMLPPNVIPVIIRANDDDERNGGLSKNVTIQLVGEEQISNDLWLDVDDDMFSEEVPSPIPLYLQQQRMEHQRYQQQAGLSPNHLISSNNNGAGHPVEKASSPPKPDANGDGTTIRKASRVAGKDGYAIPIFSLSPSRPSPPQPQSEAAAANANGATTFTSRNDAVEATNGIPNRRRAPSDGENGQKSRNNNNNNIILTNPSATAARGGQTVVFSPSGVRVVGKAEDEREKIPQKSSPEPMSPVVKLSSETMFFSPPPASSSSSPSRSPQGQHLPPSSPRNNGRKIDFASLVLENVKESNQVQAAAKMIEKRRESNDGVINRTQPNGNGGIGVALRRVNSFDSVQELKKKSPHSSPQQRSNNPNPHLLPSPPMSPPGLPPPSPKNKNANNNNNNGNLTVSLLSPMEERYLSKYVNGEEEPLRPLRSPKRSPSPSVRNKDFMYFPEVVERRKSDVVENGNNNTNTNNSNGNSNNSNSNSNSPERRYPRRPSKLSQIRPSFLDEFLDPTLSNNNNNGDVSLIGTNRNSPIRNGSPTPRNNSNNASGYHLGENSNVNNISKVSNPTPSSPPRLSEAAMLVAHKILQSMSPPSSPPRGGGASHNNNSMVVASPPMNNKWWGVETSEWQPAKSFLPIMIFPQLPSAAPLTNAPLIYLPPPTSSPPLSVNHSPPLSAPYSASPPFFTSSPSYYFP